MIVEELIDHQDHTSTQLEKEIGQLRIIISHAPGNLFWKSRTGQYLGCNQSVLDMHGLNHQSDFVGKTVYDFYDKDHADEITAKDQLVFEGDQPVLMEEVGYDKWGKQSIYLTRKIPLHNTQGEVTGLIGISLDITAQKTVDRLVKREEIQRKVIQKLKTIAGSLSHEIRTPLAAIRMGLLLLKQFFSSARQDPAQITHESLEHQEHWVERLIDKVDTGTALINIQLKNMATERINTDDFIVGDLSQWVKQSVETFPFEDVSLRQKVHLEVCSEARIVGDPLLTQHVIWNLLNNAFHFIKETGRGEIFIVVERIADNYVLRFKDTAKGMSRKEATQVFEQFYTNRSGGCGLGLHFCQLVMEAYQGRIECRAQEGLYTEFLLFFPKEAVFDLESVRLETKELQA